MNGFASLPWRRLKTLERRRPPTSHHSSSSSTVPIPWRHIGRLRFWGDPGRMRRMRWRCWWPVSSRRLNCRCGSGRPGRWERSVLRPLQPGERSSELWGREMSGWPVWQTRPSRRSAVNSNESAPWQPIRKPWGTGSVHALSRSAWSQRRWPCRRALDRMACKPPSRRPASSQSTWQRRRRCHRSCQSPWRLRRPLLLPRQAWHRSHSRRSRMRPRQPH